MEEKHRIKIIAIAKDESAYIPQWIHHHLHFGFDAVELWLNDLSDNSVALLRCIQEELGEDVVSFVEADDVLARCVQTNRHFQVEAYNLAYRREAGRGEFTHLMFMDMDELWTPANFQDSIKNVLNDFPDSDAISFLWMVDVPDLQKPSFSRPFFLENNFQKNRHVKSLVRISPSVKRVGIHNHVVDGSFHLCDGSAFDPAEDVRRVNWAYLSVPQFKGRLQTPEPYFLVHQMYRSKDEYMSSLLRGRRHTGDRKNIFKTNRGGYLPPNDDALTEEFRVSEESLSRYDAGFMDFLARTRVMDHLRKAQDFIVDRCEAAYATLRADPSLTKKFARQLQGVPDVEATVTGDAIYGKVDSTSRGSHDDCLEIKGWAYDVELGRLLKFQYVDASGAVTPLLSHRVARPEMSAKRRELGLDCGFRLEITPEQASAIEADASGDRFDILVKTYDGKEDHTLSVDKARLRATRPGGARNVREPYGKVLSAAVADSVLSFACHVYCEPDAAVEVYAAFDGLLFPLKIEALVPGDGEEGMQLAATLSLSIVPRELQRKMPIIHVSVDGRSYPLAGADGFSYPVDAITAFYRSQIPVLAIKSSLPKQEHACLLGLLPKSEAYLTYGALDTSVIAIAAGVTSVVAADSNPVLLKAVAERVAAEGKTAEQVFFPVHADIGKTKSLGYPADNSGWQSYSTYAIKPWDLCGAKGVSPDLVLIDARFRVSCFLVSLMMARPGTIVLFDDYLDRPQYHIVEKLLKPVEVHGRMAKFIVPDEFDSRLLLSILLRNCMNAI